MKGKIVLLLIALGLISYVVVSKMANDFEISPNPLVTEQESSVSPFDAVTLSVSPTSVLQGELAVVTIDGPINSSALTGLTLGGEALTVFHMEDRLMALIGVNLHKAPGVYPVILYLADGRTIEKNLEIKERVLPVSEFSIPESFGGNTPAGEQELTENLESDSEILNSVTSVVSPEKFWEGEFRYPLDGTPVITDTYGYSRQTGSTNISHNGTDFRAAVGTPVYAMNDGQIVFDGTFRNYGKTVIIDHGLGLMTMYMHLSEVNTPLGKRVAKGELIAKSGNTGYSLGPHLHLSVRLNGSSLDPEKFLQLMGER